jgi:hypothetical protein
VGESAQDVVISSVCDVKSKFERRGMVKFTTKGGLDLQQELAKLANGRAAFSGSLEKKCA